MEIFIPILAGVGALSLIVILLVFIFSVIFTHIIGKSIDKTSEYMDTTWQSEAAKHYRKDDKGETNE